MFLKDQLVNNTVEVGKQKFFNEICISIPPHIEHNNCRGDMLEEQSNIDNNTVEGIDE